MASGFGNIAQTLAGNYSEKSVSELTGEYGKYLFSEEEVQMGFQLVRDALVFTNKRILFVDKQGATGKKLPSSQSTFLLWSMFVWKLLEADWMTIKSSLLS